MNPVIKNKLMDIGIGLLAILSGAAIVYLGDRLLEIRLEYYFGIATFSPAWAVDVFCVTFIAGFVVSLIYGLGGKMLAHFSPIIVRIFSYYQVHHGFVPPKGYSILPIGFWLLIVVLSAEFSAFGGVIGEVVVKRTYGRTSNKALLHRKFQRKKGLPGAGDKTVITTQKETAEGIKP
jgi:hypothetical protein